MYAFLSLVLLGSLLPACRSDGPSGPAVPESDFQVLAQRPVDEIWPGPGADIYPEGFVMDPAGSWLYAANYGTGEIVRIDPGTLLVVDRLQLLPWVEGLAVTPAGDRLFAIHKVGGLSVVDLESFTATHLEGFGGYFIQALDESHALIGGGFGLQRVNVDTRDFESATLPPGETHFSVSPDATRVVSVVTPLEGDPSLEIFSLPKLDLIRSIPLGELPLRRHVALDPSGDLIYVFASGSAEVRFLAVSSTTGAVITSKSVNGGGCVIYCVANPVVSFGSGRYVAFEVGGAVSVVDTALDLPRYIFDPEGAALRDGYSPSGVAAHPDSDVLYVLGPTGRLFKLRLRNST
jgi:DNA-binding beta-propeller fold protein YncE